MTKRNAGGANASELRRLAEERLRERRARSSPPTGEEALRLLQELEVHQFELEIQNEELQATRRQAEDAAARYTELYDFAPVGYATLSGDGIIRAINLAGATLLGPERAQLVGRRLASFVSAGDLALLAQLLSQVLRVEPGGRVSSELSFGDEDRPSRRLRLTAATLPVERKEVLLAFEDVSERNRQEQELRQLLRERADLLRLSEEARAAAERANRAKDAFMASLSHELRNPLSPISNSLFVLERSPDGEVARRAIAVIHRQVRHLTRLVDDLLDVTRVTAGKIQLHRQTLDLNELASTLVEDHRSLFDQSGVRLELARAPEPVPVDGDWHRLAQVVGNLLQNSAKFCQRGGTTRVAVARDLDARQAVLRVADDGAGLAPEMVPRLFQPFVQADTTLDRSQGGLGLGLALARGLTELHGGSIRAHSEGLGQGTTFEVRLPAAPGVASPPRVVPDDHRGPGRRVLIVDDNADAADSLRELLERRGHQVRVAYSGPEGLAVAREFRPDVVLCDIGLPGMDGYDLAMAIRADDTLRGAFLVALTGYAQPGDTRRAAESGFQRHVSKPADPDKLERILECLAAPAPAPPLGRG